MKYPIKKIKKEIAKKEKSTGRKLSEKGRRKVAQKVIRRTKMRNRLIATLAALGITVGGAQALLTDGNQANQPENKTNIEMDNQKNVTNNKREAYLKELNVDTDQYHKDETSQEKDTQIIDQILENYNENLLEQAKIDKDDLGIISQKDAHLLKDFSEDGDISFVEYGSKEEYGNLQEGQEWVKADDIDTIYVLVDTENNNTIAGIGAMDGGCYEIDVESVRNRSNGIEYMKNDKTYVGLPEEKDSEEVYKNFANYYQERTAAIKKAQENDGMEL